MLFLKEVTESKPCEVDIDYYVPFTIRLKTEKRYAPKVCWRIGNFKDSLMEISIDEKTGMLREAALISVHTARLADAVLENANLMKNGTPVFRLEGSAKNGLCNRALDFNVRLNEEFIGVNLSEGEHPVKCVELERIQFGFDKDSKLISVIVKDLSADEYKELKDGLKL